MSGTTILISPLNWGFGHAGRMIPLALELKKRGHEVIFGADANLLPLIADELPGFRLIEIPGLRIRYSRFLPQYLSIFLQLPLVAFHAVREHYALIRLAEQVRPSVIISDNRFGFYHRRIFSVYVTHQLRIPFPRLLRFMEPAAAWLHRMIIRRYDLCLVPDYPGPVNLSGRLSHDIITPGKMHYMGPLSRFRLPEPSVHNLPLPEPYCCLILSGPEPQHSLLFKKVVAALGGTRIVVLSATPVQTTRKSFPGVTFIIKPDTGTMRRIILNSSLIITRAGYTSVMELTSLGKGAVLIPAPGQTEQEYLGDYLNGHHGFVSVRQDKIKGLFHSAASGSITGGYEFHDSAVVTESNEMPPAGIDASAAMQESPPAEKAVVAEPAAHPFPDCATLFEKAIELLLEQKKE